LLYITIQIGELWLWESPWGIKILMGVKKFCKTYIIWPIAMKFVLCLWLPFGEISRSTCCVRVKGLFVHSAFMPAKARFSCCYICDYDIFMFLLKRDYVLAQQYALSYEQFL